MGERSKEHRASSVESGERTAPGHAKSFAASGATLNKALRILAPNNTAEQLLAAFDNRTTLNTIKSWRHGWRTVAPWAIELIEFKATQLANAARDLPRGIGSASAGKKNLRPGAYHYPQSSSR